MSAKQIILISITISLITLGCKTQQVVPSQQKLPRVENVHFTQQADTVNIYYDLLAASSNTEFDIQLMMSLGDEKRYQIDTTSASGAIGSGVVPGKKKQISWRILDDFPEGMQGKQIQFIVNANKVSEKNNNWIYIGSGALLLGAGAVVSYMLLSPGEASLPIPPSRPSGN